MIYGKIKDLPFWAEKIPSLKYALTEAKNVADKPFTLGKTVIDSESLFASSSEYTAESRETKIFENHHAYIDVQMLIEGEEDIDVIIPDTAPASEYSAEKDIEFAAFDKDYSTVTLRAGDFLILLPGEWHRPGVAIDKTGANCQKTVVKVRN
ncbi:MAG: YhcH/YjgK/YiaL family protein [Clostridia bacterium]|nr:YhcH/YjgK/YiaL family protein [Clostridia bacterium]